LGIYLKETKELAHISFKGIFVGEVSYPIPMWFVYIPTSQRMIPPFVKPIKRRRKKSMEGEHQVKRKNQLTKKFMPNYRTLKKKPHRKNCMSSRVMFHWLHLWHPHTWMVWNKVHLHNNPIASNNNDLQCKI
jgi:hypothetical protein